MKTILPLVLVLIAVALYFFVSNTAPKTVHEAPSPTATIHTIKEKFITDFNRADNIDSMVVYKDPSLGRVLIATAKNSNALVVYSAETGRFIKRVTDVGFVRPNGITMFPDKDILVVVERDGHQMVFVSLPDFKHIASFGESVLVRPYASAVVKTKDPNVYNIFVTDNYMDLEYSDKHGKMKPKKVPPVERLDGRVQMFQITVGADGHSLTDMKHLRKVGDNFGDGALHVVETIVADEELDNLLIADERRNNIKVYKLSTLTFTGVLIGDKFFEVDPEGFALYKCKEGTGFWVTTEQLRHPHKTKFHLFDRSTFEHVGSFSGNETRMTDGVALTQDAFGPFNAGAFYAAHGDASIAAFSIEDIAKTLNLAIQCTNPK